MTSRTDAENRKILDTLIPTYDRLKADMIRAESEVERLERELAEAEKQAIEDLGTADEAQIEQMIMEAREANTQTVDEFANIVRGVQANLSRLGTGA